MPDVLHSLMGYLTDYGYVALFFGVMLENAGVPLPGETALLAAGYLSSPEGGGHFHVWTVILVAFAGASIGDNIGYWLGRTVIRRRMEQGKGFLFLSRERLLKAETYFAKYGVLTVFFARFVALLRIVGGPAAGASGMKWPRFFAANVAGAIVWATIITLLGHWAGGMWESLHQWLGRGSWVILGVVVLGVALWHLLPLLRRKSAVPTMESSLVGPAVPDSSNLQESGTAGPTKTVPPTESTL